jgi:DNA-binding NtrC family response regulator
MGCGGGDILPLEPFREYLREAASGGKGDGRTGAGGAAASLTAAENLPSLKESEELAIRAALQRAGGSQKEAARVLGMSPSALSRRLRRMSAGISGRE